MRADLADSNGHVFGVKHLGGQLQVISEPYHDAIITGEISGHFGLKKFGLVSGVNNVQQDVWNVGGQYIFPTAPTQMTVFSTNAGDTSGGNGIHRVDIHYLDSNYTEQETYVTLTGTSGARTSATNIMRVNKFHAIAAGGSGAAIGSINICALGASSPVYARIDPGTNNANNAIWSVPVSHTLLLTHLTVGAGATTAGHFAIFRLKSTNNELELTSGMFQTHDMMIIQDGAQDINHPMPIIIPGKSDVKVSVVSDAVNANVIATTHFGGWYEYE